MQEHQSRVVLDPGVKTLMISVPLAGANLMTLDEFLAWKPENARYELHQGTPVEMQPTGDHEAIVEFLSTTLIRAAGLAGMNYRFPRQALIKVPETETEYLPDVLVVDPAALANEPRWKKSATLIYGSSIPLVIEVVSSNWRDDYAHKLVDYETLGISEYWIVDYLGLGGVRYIGSPKQPTISIYQLVGDEYQGQQFRGGERLVSRLFPALTLTAEAIFSAVELQR
jgi:Uma2 family endonuclease